MISKYRPSADILAITFDERTQRGLTVNWGVDPIVTDRPENTDAMFDLATQKAQELGFAQEGDLILIVAGVPVGESGTTNLMKVQLIGSKLVKGQGVGDETVVGKAVIAHSAEEAAQKISEGDILVVETTDKDYLPAIEKASALIVENGGLTSHEGMNHQVKEMFNKVGYPVVKLKRERVGFLTLQGLNSGDWRFLQHEEVSALKKL